MNDRPKIIAITGCTGVLGRILTRKLSDQDVSFDCFKGDLSATQEVASWIDEIDPDYLVHFAALVPVNKVDSDIARALEVNVFGTSNLLKAISYKKILPWIFIASSSHVYSSQEGDISENDQLQPVTNYGKTKLMAELVADYYASTYNLNICIGRIFSFYHHTQKEPFLYPAILKRLETHDPSNVFELRGGNNVRDISNAEEIVEKILALLKVKYNGEVNIGNGEGVTIKDFVQSISKIPLKIVIPDGPAHTRLVANLDKFKRVTNER